MNRKLHAKCQNENVADQRQPQLPAKVACVWVYASRVCVGKHMHVLVCATMDRQKASCVRLKERLNKSDNSNNI